MLLDLSTMKVAKPPAPQPSLAFRFVTMFQHFMMYSIREPGLYIYRLYSFVIIAIFIGTLFLNLETNTDHITQFAGSLYFTSLGCLLLAVTATSVFAKDRYEAVDRIRNGVYTPGVFVLSQFLSSAIYCFVVTFVFIAMYHWLSNLNPNGEAFVYDIMINWGHSMLMEATLHIIIELLKNDFLSVTSALVFLGSNMAFSGFFRPVDQMPAWISWMCYVVPLRWSFDGFVWQIFVSQDFTVVNSNPPVKVSGETILNNVFNLRDINAWGMFGTLLGYVALFRLIQYLLLAWQTDTLFASSAPKTKNLTVTDEQGKNTQVVTGSIELARHENV